MSTNGEAFLEVVKRINELDDRPNIKLITRRIIDDKEFFRDFTNLVQMIAVLHPAFLKLLKDTQVATAVSFLFGPTDSDN